jgi:glycine/D-amino acid oxidase-like deaminating enzyme
MAKTFDALIVGAGIVGAACASELAEAGMSVGIIERDTIGSGATAAGMGHIVVMDDSPAQLRLTRYSQTLWDALAREAPTEHEYTRCGTIWVATDEEEMRAVHAKHALFKTYDVPGEILDANQLYALEPHLRPGLAGGLLVPEDSVVYPPRSAASLIRQAERRGATLLYGTVTRLEEQGVGLTDGQTIKGGIVILANGARATELVPELPIRPKKGHLVITDRYPGFVHHQLVELGYVKNAHATSGDSVAFNVQPRGTGQVLIGSSRQFDAPDSEIDHAILSRMLASALAYLPELGQLNCIRCWTGFRAATPDGLPLIGPHPERPDFWLATGHEGLGITTAPATAHLLAALVLGRAPAIPAEPYLPARSFQEEEHV